MLEWLEMLFEGHVHDPDEFIRTLQRFHETEPDQRGPLANALSDLIISKRVDLAEVRRRLLDTGRHDLFDALHRLTDLIEPYIEEGGVDE